MKKSTRFNVCKKFDIIIGTTGRIIDYIQTNIFSLEGIQVAVLDEADRLLFD